MGRFASGKYAKAISDRSGLEFPYTEMVREWNGSFVHISEYEEKQPQLQPRAKSAYPQGLIELDLTEQNQLHQIYYQVTHLV